MLSLTEVRTGPRQQALPKASEPIAAWIALEPRAWRDLFERYYRKMYSFAYVRTGDVHLAEEIASEVFAAAARGISRYRDTGAPIGPGSTASPVTSPPTTSTGALNGPAFPSMTCRLRRRAWPQASKTPPTWLKASQANFEATGSHRTALLRRLHAAGNGGFSRQKRRRREAAAA